MRIKVLQVIDGSEFAGGEKVVYQLAKGLDRQRYESIVACAPKGLFADMLREADVEVFDADMKSKYNVPLIPRLAKFMKQRGISVVHTHGPRANFFGRIAARLSGVPVVVVSTLALIIGRESHADVSKLRRSTYLLLDKLTSVYVDRFLVLSELHQQALAADYDIAPGRITKIYNGIELDEYDAKQDKGNAVREELGMASCIPVVGVVGRLAFEKGLPFLLQAASKVKEAFPKVKFLIVGDGPLKAELQSLAKKLGIYENCIFTGFRQDIPDILSAIDMLVMSSLYEGMPMVILEAMAASKPVIATSVGGIPELVKDGETGMLIPPKDVDALADSIIALLKNKDKARRMGLAGRKRVEEKFDVRIMVRKTEEVYHELIREKLGCEE